MKMQKFEFAGQGGTILPAVVWLPESTPRALLQVTHGMTEHMGRYTAFAQELTDRGIVVAGFDLRGHGQNPGNGRIASFGEGGWGCSIEDMHCFFSELERRFSGLPHHMLGFSLGSFLLREYLGRYPDGVAGAVVMGTGHQPGAVLSVMMSIVKGQIGKAGFDGTTNLVQQLSFGIYNQKFKSNRTAADWLCVDETQLDAYLADPLCRQGISAGLFWEMLGAMRRTGSAQAYTGWNRKLPVLLLSGGDDPVGDAGKGVQAVKQRMERAGMERVSLQLLPSARHDVLHEEASGAAAKARALIGDWVLKGTPA